MGIIIEYIPHTEELEFEKRNGVIMNFGRSMPF